MAITIKDIHEKEFSRQVRGYSIDEVDDFLDQLATQMEAMIRENREAIAAAEEAKAAAATVQAVPAVVAQPVQAIQPAQSAPAPTFDEPQYFKNLETTVRETLINAQRLADETIADARKKANAMVAAAEEQAASITAAAKTEADNARNETAELKQAAEDDRGRFMRLLEEQAHLLKADDTLFAK